ncbi:MAG: helix-turn-helix domain-containing protein [Flavobacteriaceae bacterium]
MSHQGLHHVFLPKSDLLKRYVASFNVLRADRDEKSAITYYTFPQSGTEIVFFNQSEIIVNDNEIGIRKDSRKKAEVVFCGKFLTPIKVTYWDRVQKIAVHFTETGIINFFPNYYMSYGKKNLQRLPMDTLGLDPTRLFSEDVESAIEHLEAYLLSLYSPNSLSVIEQAAEMVKTNPTMRTGELAKQAKMGKKTFARQFKKHVGCTVSNFKRISQFKKTARSYFDGPHKNLVQLCYDNGYYAASDFYRQIRRTTRLNPKEFFKNIQRIGPKNRIYIFE